MITRKTGGLNEISGLGQCQYPGGDIVLQFGKKSLEETS